MQGQRSFEDLGTPLSEVTFCVVDLETTGGSPASCAITEVGASKIRCGRIVGTFDTLVNPGCPVPPYITMLTGIDDILVEEAPPIENVIPSFLEFCRGTVLVAHNARFDVAFLNAALDRNGYERLENRVLDTARLARKILAGEVPNNRLETIARHLRCAHRPSHRAYPDVLATIDVLHHLIERVAGFGVTTLEDLVQISCTKIDGTFRKIRLTDGFPRGPGIYRFRASDGSTLYVGKASDLRSRVRSYFYGDPRNKIRNLLRETDAIDHERHESLLEAEIAEARAIAKELPPYNRAGKRRGEWFVKLDKKISATRIVRDDGRTYLGPLPSLKTARTLIEGLRDAARIHRCADPIKCGGCAFADLGACARGRDAQRVEIERLASSLRMDPAAVFDGLAGRMMRLARQERFEEAAEVRDRGALLERTLKRRIEAAAWAGAGRIELEIGGRTLRFDGGRLADGADPAPDEWRVLSAWLRRHGVKARLLGCTGTLALPVALGVPSRFVSRAPAAT